MDGGQDRGSPWQVLAAVAIVLLLVVFGGIGRGYGVAYLLFFVTLGGFGWYLATRRNRAAAIAGQTIAAMAGAALLYFPTVAAALFIFASAIQRYDAPSAGFQVWFWACYGGPVLITVALLAVITRHLGRPWLITVVASGTLLALAALPALAILSVVALCSQDIEYIGSGSCPVR